MQAAASIFSIALGYRRAVQADATGCHAPKPGTYQIPRPFSFLVREAGVQASEEYLTVAEVAAVLKVSPKRVRNMMSSGAFRAGEHFFRRRGIGPRFVRSRVGAWLREDEGVSVDSIPMARCAGGRFGRRSVASA